MSQEIKCAACNGTGYIDVGDPETGPKKWDYLCEECAGTGICFFCGKQMDAIHDDDCPQREA